MRITLLATLLLLAPAAQAIQIHPPTPTEPLQPDTPWEGQLRFVIDCSDLFGADPSPTLTWNASSDEDFSVQGARNLLVDRAECTTPSGQIEREVAIKLTGSRHVLAEASHKITFEAQIEGDPDTESTGTMRAETAYWSTLSAKAPNALLQGGPQKQLSYDVQIDVWANAPTRVTFELLDHPGGKWQGIVPDQLVIPPFGEGDPQATFVVSTPFQNGNNNDEAGWTLKVIGQSATTGAPGDEAELDLVSRVRGVYVPGPGVAFLPLLLAGAALRLRKE